MITLLVWVSFGALAGALTSLYGWMTGIVVSLLLPQWLGFVADLARASHARPGSRERRCDRCWRLLVGLPGAVAGVLGTWLAVAGTSVGSGVLLGALAPLVLLGYGRVLYAVTRRPARS